VTGRYGVTLSWSVQGGSACLQWYERRSNAIFSYTSLSGTENQPGSTASRNQYHTTWVLASERRCSDGAEAASRHATIRSTIEKHDAIHETGSTLQRRQRRTEPLPRATCTENETCVSGSMRADTLAAVLRPLTGGGGGGGCRRLCSMYCTGTCTVTRDISITTWLPTINPELNVDATTATHEIHSYVHHAGRPRPWADPASTQITTNTATNDST